MGVDATVCRLGCARACAVRLKAFDREGRYFCQHERMSLVCSVCVAVQPLSSCVSRDKERSREKVPL